MATATPNPGGPVEFIRLYFNASGLPFALIRYQDYTGVYEYEAVKYLAAHAGNPEDRLAFEDICEAQEAAKYGKFPDIRV